VSTAIIQLLVGLVLLAAGGHAIVRGAISVALLARISTAVVGLTVVAFGTSLPELAVSLRAAATGHAQISYANVVGSNIFNIAAVLGLVALVRPVTVSRSLRLQYPGMLVVMILCVVFAYGGHVTRLEGLFLVGGLVAFMGFTVYVVRTGRDLLDPEEAEEEVRSVGAVRGPPLRAWLLSLLLVVGGIGALSWGADQLVAGAVTLARLAGMTERVIGLTVIAMGTSLPELAATLAASRHGDPDIVMGNLLGSNIFNVLAILGLTAAIFPVPVDPRAIALDNWMMLGTAAVIGPMMAARRKVGRIDGGILLLGFSVYIAVLLTIG